MTQAVHHSWEIASHTSSLLLQKAQQHISNLRFVNTQKQYSKLLNEFFLLSEIVVRQIKYVIIACAGNLVGSYICG